MGGEKTGCSESTTDVLIETALWVPMNIAQTGRKLGINSDARYRFERGVDPAFMVPGLELATHMVVDLCGGKPSDVVVAGSAAVPERVIDFPVAETQRLTGLAVPPNDARGVLEKLGFKLAGQGARVKVTPPSRRLWTSSSLKAPPRLASFALTLARTSVSAAECCGVEEDEAAVEGVAVVEDAGVVGEGCGVVPAGVVAGAGLVAGGVGVGAALEGSRAMGTGTTSPVRMPRSLCTVSPGSYPPAVARMV